MKMDAAVRATLRRKMTADRRTLAAALGCEDARTAVSAYVDCAGRGLLVRAGRRERGAERLRVADTGTDRGQGVFVGGSSVGGGGGGGVKRGQALCFYGGLIYTRDEVAWLGGSPMCFQQSDPNFQEGVRAANLSYLLGASGGAVINGAPGLGPLGIDVKLSGPEENISMSHRGKEDMPSIGWDPRQTFNCIDALKEREGDENAGLCVDAAAWEARIRDDAFLSMGSKINHPPVGHDANVVGWPVTLDINADRGYATNSEKNDDSGGGGSMFAPCVFGIRGSQLGHGRVVCSNNSVLFVAVRDMEEGEELYLDYKIVETAGGKPEWYSEAGALEYDATHALRESRDGKIPTFWR